MRLRDWLPRPRPSVPAAWQVTREGSVLVVSSGAGDALRLPLDGVRAVRIVPLTGGNHHMQRSRGSWQVCLQRADGDVLVGKPLADWQPAYELAQSVCTASGLSLDELTERMFSGVFLKSSRK